MKGGEVYWAITISTSSSQAERGRLEEGKSVHTSSLELWESNPPRNQN
jgi:hypothetical protein